jgi:hypothetical protein
MLGHRLEEHSEDLDLACDDIIEHPDLPYAEPKLGLGQSLEPLDAALAHLRGLMPQVDFQGVPHTGPDVGVQTPEVLDGVGKKDDLIAHFCETLS